MIIILIMKIKIMKKKIMKMKITMMILINYLIQIKKIFLNLEKILKKVKLIFYFINLEPELEEEDNDEKEEKNQENINQKEEVNNKEKNNFNINSKSHNSSNKKEKPIEESGTNSIQYNEILRYF